MKKIKKLELKNGDTTAMILLNSYAKINELIEFVEAMENHRNFIDYEIKALGDVVNKLQEGEKDE